MLFYTDEASASAINRIEYLIRKIGSVSGDQFSYLDAREAGNYLSMLIDVIEKERKVYESRATKTAKHLSGYIAKNIHSCPIPESVSVSDCECWGSKMCADCIRKNAHHLK